jgi:hypothetical protein
MNTTGYHINVSTSERVTALLAIARADWILAPLASSTGSTEGPDIMNLSENILLAHYQRERR